MCEPPETLPENSVMELAELPAENNNSPKQSAKVRRLLIQSGFEYPASRLVGTINWLLIKNHVFAVGWARREKSIFLFLHFSVFPIAFGVCVCIELMGRFQSFTTFSSFGISTRHFSLSQCHSMDVFSAVRLCGRIHLPAIVRFFNFPFSQCGSSTPNNLASTFLCFSVHFRRRYQRRAKLSRVTLRTVIFKGFPPIMQKDPPHNQWKLSNAEVDLKISLANRTVNFPCSPSFNQLHLNWMTNRSPDFLLVVHSVFFSFNSFNEAGNKNQWRHNDFFSPK